MKKVTVGILGEKKNLDCNIELTIKDSGGIKIDLKSRVEAFYGDSIRKLIHTELSFFGIENVRITVEDYGALPFVIQARIETAIKRAIPDINKEFLPEFSDKCLYGSSRDRFRRSRLYLPGNFPKFMINAGIHNPDGIILDLEDSVAPSEKDAARALIRNALRVVNFYSAERMVRINQLPMGLLDLEWVIPHNTHLILIPKCESADTVKQVDEKIKETKNDVFLMPIVESALGVINSYEIAKASSNVVALAIGLEDYTADIGTPRTKEGKESFLARSMVVNAAHAAGVQPIDTVFSDVDDAEGLRESILEAKSLGFVGKGCIHPRQIRIIHEAFAPTEEEIEKAKRIVNAFLQAKEKNLSVVSLGSKMIDPPVVKRAEKIVELAIKTGKLDEGWRNNE
ncbi:HpcH/HpaI aldolase/citrate lyase family protein [candidate division WOR-3 bacterium]|nr:HpcH/HpaI aldolase/citrate lyase family protein [candidate division WOR-3 bacterium]